MSLSDADDIAHRAAIRFDYLLKRKRTRFESFRSKK